MLVDNLRARVTDAVAPILDAVSQPAATVSSLVDEAESLVDLREENDFFPDLDAIDPRDAARAKVMWLNYPNSPTGKVATREFYERMIELAHRHQFVIVQDAAVLDA